ncbi:hypothetical protein QBC39DRAFT_335080 [Podospora conica]|nr:hypothetical protein QBC39DRAFT_335080 [Schizothecium conicum]
MVSWARRSSRVAQGAPWQRLIVWLEISQLVEARLLSATQLLFAIWKTQLSAAGHGVPSSTTINGEDGPESRRDTFHPDEPVYREPGAYSASLCAPRNCRAGPVLPQNDQKKHQLPGDDQSSKTPQTTITTSPRAGGEKHLLSPQLPRRATMRESLSAVYGLLGTSEVHQDWSL